MSVGNGSDLKRFLPPPEHLETSRLPVSTVTITTPPSPTPPCHVEHSRSTTHEGALAANNRSLLPTATRRTPQPPGNTITPSVPSANAVIINTTPPGSHRTSIGKNSIPRMATTSSNATSHSSSVTSRDATVPSCLTALTNVADNNQDESKDLLRQ